ncbi:transcription-repair coupling factor [Planctomycetales bacterium ZRK34]|nr:transcription-repair coupling factor [Planctomycetales bacterium ZRK34]
MAMKHDWIKQIVEHESISRLAGLTEPGKRLVAEGAWGSSAHLTAGAIAQRSGRCVLLVVAHLDEADEAVEDLGLFEGLEAVAFPALEVLPGESNVSLELLADRLAVVTRLARGDQPAVLVAPVQALMQAVPTDEAMGTMVLELARGGTQDPQALTHWLVEAGYRRVDVIEEPGDFAMRGGIIDVYPPGASPAVRLDFFGDQIDEIAEIDVDSMGSDRKIDRVRLIGASVAKIQAEQRTTNLWSLLRDDTIVVEHERLEIDEQARGYYERLTDPTGIYAPGTLNIALSKLSVIEINQYGGAGMGHERVALPVSPLVNFPEEGSKAVAELIELAREHRVVVLAQRTAERERLLELIQQQGDGAGIDVEVGYLFRGFTWGDEQSAASGGAQRVVIVPHQEMFHRYGMRRRIRKISASRAVDAFLDIEPNDYVVHQQHGIARFKGMRLMKRSGATGQGGGKEEYLTLEFADRALLHVPASQIELVHKYIGGFAGRPPLSKLGSKKWSKQKEQVAEAVRDLAAELLRVQAARQASPGIAYGPPTAWMKQFEAEFPYQETDDQLVAIASIHKDMAESKPMDRLICGDVGYGKTEVAMRAAFRAVEAGKQVAVLCPTTVLSEQHERTFRERMADYPVCIESLNRFKNAQQVRGTLQGLSEGTVDIVIGTHRLLSDDIYFKDLGLVIVDEEQRFGVEHKSKLMRFRVTVDVLTLSATPIPRTLHMAMLGLRDISSLSTPPADRRAVVTEVAPYDTRRIRNAIVRELNRGGQCFFVHNRVGSIHAVAAEIQTLVPEAKLAVGHGQMHGHELEEVMLRFVRGEVDVLVCTTIIESGIDIPTANTMFIADADRFGLAELHQLRGRVGRYKHRAYCYMMLPKNRPLSEIATRRLNAIEEFSMLGAGFKIAMRDMEIRGVGNLLGPQQSGHIAAVGYEMYCKLLEQATADLQHHRVREPVLTHLDLGLAGNLPRTYIPSDKHRMQAYRRISRSPDLKTLAAVEADLQNAYGELPPAARMLVDLAEIRVALSQLNVEALKRDDDDLVFTTKAVAALSPMLSVARGSVRLVDTPEPDHPGTVYYRPPASYLKEASTLLAVLQRLLVEPVREATDQPAQNTSESVA